MITLLTHTVAHFTKPSFRPKSTNQPLKKFLTEDLYSRVPNRSPCAFISGKVCLLGSIKVRRQTLPEINAQGLLFGTLEYNKCENDGNNLKNDSLQEKRKW